MNQILPYFIKQLILSAKSFGMKFKESDIHPKNLAKKSYRVFEIPYFGHASGLFRIIIEHEAFEKYSKVVSTSHSPQKAVSLFDEIMTAAINATISRFDQFEHCTVGFLRSFSTPVYEPKVKMMEGGIFYVSCESYLNVIIYLDKRKTDLSKVYDKQQKEKEEISLKAQKLEEEKLTLNAQKFEAIGQLAAGVAHEINTPIQFVSDNVNFLSVAFKKIINNIDNLHNIDLDFYTGEIPSALDETKDGLARIAAIIKSLKEFSHPGNDEIQLYPVKHLIENCIALTKNEFKYVADIETNIEDLKLLIYPNKLSQVLVNMIVNSSHSIRDKYKGKKQGLISIKFYKSDENYVFEIADNGSGIKQEYIDKVFNPFFTTKGIGEGTGQGLAICKKIIEENHKGQIYIQSNSKNGLCFKIIIRELES